MRRKNISFLTAIFLVLFFFPVSCENFPLSCKTNMIHNIEDTFEKSISISEPPGLEVKISQGNINITRGNDNEVKVKSIFKIYGVKEEDIKVTAEAIKKDPPIEIKDKIIKIGNLKKYNVDKWFSEKKVVMDLNILTPAKTSVIVDTGSGNISISSLGSSVKAVTGLGNIKVENTESADTKTGSGYVKIIGVAKDVNVASGKGSIELKVLQGNVSAKTGLGDIIISSAINEDKKWSLDSGLGNIELKLTPGSTFTFSCVTGIGKIDFNLKGEITNKTERRLEGKVGTNPSASINIKVGKGDISLSESGNLLEV